jgi:hypothetical protein
MTTPWRCSRGQQGRRAGVAEIMQAYRRRKCLLAVLVLGDVDPDSGPDQQGPERPVEVARVDRCAPFGAEDKAVVRPTNIGP